MNDRELQWALIVEQEYLLHSQLPSHDRINQLAGGVAFTPAFYQRCMDSEEVRNHLESRGVPIRRIVDNAGSGALSLEQLVCVNTLLDFNDTRSDRKKLESLQISSSKYAAWKKDPAFQAYIRQRAENLFGDNIDEVHRALLDNARSGDLGSVKLIYELTGRYNPRADGQIDAKALLTQILEIIMRRVSNPEEKRAIAADFQLLAQANRVTGQQVIESHDVKEISA